MTQRLVTIATLVAVLGGVLPAMTAVAQDTGDALEPLNVMVLLDISESMNESAGEGTKIAAAKAAVTGLTQSAPDATRLGLHVFPAPGSRCGSGRTVAGIGTLSPLTVSRTLAGLDPDGDTPMAEALREAAARLPDFGRNVIILVSDGEANCDEPACPVAQDLAAGGFDVRIHAVAFQISDEGADELRCIADATDGSFIDVDDEDQLEQIVSGLADATVDLTVEAPTSVRLPGLPALPDPVTVQATLTNVGPGRLEDGTLSLGFTGGIQPTLPVPTYQIGSVAEGESRVYSWTFLPQTSLTTYQLPFNVTTLAVNADPVEISGTLTVVGREDALGQAGPVLANATRPVILGDSFSSGEGAMEYIEGTNEDWNRCHRSHLTYGHGLWSEREIIACSGAVALDILAGQEGRSVDAAGTPLPSQQNQLADLASRPDLALLTLGGNDVAFSLLLGKCLIPNSTDCATEEIARACKNLLEWFTCDVEDPDLRGLTGREVVDLLLPTLRDRLEPSYRAIDNQLNASNDPDGVPTQIVVLAYMDPLPADPQNRGGCGGKIGNLTENFSPSEMEFGKDLLAGVNAEVASAVAQMQHEGRPFHFAAGVAEAAQGDPLLGTRPHDACQEDSWVNDAGLGATIAFSGSRRQEILHPNADGYVGITERLILDSRAWTHRSRAAQPVEIASACEIAGAGLTILETPDDGLVVLQEGTCYGFDLPGLQAATEIRLILQSDPILLAAAVADARGVAHVRFTLPAGVSPGHHELTTLGFEPDGGMFTGTSPVEVRDRRSLGDVVVRWTGLSILICLLAAALLFRSAHRIPFGGGVS